MIKKKIIFFGDSIVKYKTNFLVDWGDNLKKKINKKFHNKYSYYSKTVVGLNSTQSVKLFKELSSKFKIEGSIILIQIGINDSWYFKSLKGKANVSTKKYKSNLIKIIKISNKLGVKNLFFVSYHRLLKNRFEINNKTVNQNLNKYIKILEKTCHENKISYIDIPRDTKKINPKKICRPMPDGVHLSSNGAKIYTKIIFNNVKKYL